jgi:hypothetical protein
MADPPSQWGDTFCFCYDRTLWFVLRVILLHSSNFPREVSSSDATNIQTTMKREGNQIVINGHKWFVSISCFD